MKKISWGIIGCGAVTEMKSGPAFNKIKNSKLVAVMRRDAAKAADYAQRHQVPRWYANAEQLINDPEVNAIYIATPPSSHEQYTLAAFKAGKPVYIEKPMSTTAHSAQKMWETAEAANLKLCVAHYRREQPLFKKIKSLLDQNAIGEVRAVNMIYYKKMPDKESLEKPGLKWRVDPAISGGGIFHDLAPHQLDLMLYFFGDVKYANGISTNQSGQYQADDAVAGHILFRNNVLFTGMWDFAVSADCEKDICKIRGTKGSITFEVFDHQLIKLSVNGKTENIQFEVLQHVQQPMIEKVVEYFLGEGYNPGDGKNGVAVMKLLDAFTSNK